MQIKELKAKAHRLGPVVIIGARGERTGAQPVQQVGKVFVIYRRNP